jgi:hypothetical protein
LLLSKITNNKFNVGKKYYTTICLKKYETKMKEHNRTPQDWYPGENLYMVYIEENKSGLGAHVDIGEQSYEG